MEFKWRKSKSKEDVLEMAEGLAKNFDINPYTKEELAEVISAGIRGGEIKKEREGRSYYVKNVDKWFSGRLMANTVSLSKEDYKRALYRSFRLLILANIAKTDFGSSRQRDFGQMWTDFTRGFLGELGIEQYFKRNLGLEVMLEESEVGEVKNFLPTDITKIKEGGTWRGVNTNMSIKTSKLRSLWLDISSQIEHSDAFIFIKIGLTTDHLTSFIKDSKFLEGLVDMGKGLGEVSDYEQELKNLSNRIPALKSFPCYIPGFVWKDDLKEGVLEVREAGARKIVVGGRGYYEKGVGSDVEGLGNISYGKHLACLGALRWEREDWGKLKGSI